MDSVTSTILACVSYRGIFLSPIGCHCRYPLFPLNVKGEGLILGSPLRETENPGFFHSQPHLSFLYMVLNMPIAGSVSAESAV